MFIICFRMLFQVLNEQEGSAPFPSGPLTLIFKKADIVPYATSGGLETVAIRFPENKVANLLIKTAKMPIAAPSANTSGRPSPTRAPPNCLRYVLFRRSRYFPDLLRRESICPVLPHCDICYDGYSPHNH